jgi:hypothetical protein
LPNGLILPHPETTMPPRGSLAERLAGWTVVTCATLLAACGGGPVDDGADTAGGAGLERHPGHAAPVLQPPVAVGGPGHRVRLTWRGTPPAARVSAWLGDDMQDFHVIATGLRGGTTDVSLGPSWTMDWPSARLRLRACRDKGRCVDSNVQPLTDVLLAGLDKIEPLEKDGRLSNFASHIALSGDGRTLAVTDPADRPPCATPSHPGRQGISVFRRDAQGRWQREACLADPQLRANIGGPLALSGDGRTLAVRALYATPPGGTDAPTQAVHVFVREAGPAWRLQGVLQVARPAGYEAFGDRLALDRRGDRLVVSDHNDNQPRLHVFERGPGQAWRQHAVIGPAAGSRVVLGLEGGLAISGNGRVIAVHASVHLDPPQWIPIPAVHVYEPDATGTWTLRSDLRSNKPPPQGRQDDPLRDRFGNALSLNDSGTVLAVGAPEDPGDAGDPGTGPGNRNAPRAGAVYIFQAADDGWRRQAFLKPRNARPGDTFGAQVALSGNGRVLQAKACGLSANEPGVRRNHPAGTSVLPPEPPAEFPWCWWGGSAYVLTRDDAGRWTHVAAAVPIDAGHVSYRTFSVALSADASTFALGTELFLPAETIEHRMFVY